MPDPAIVALQRLGFLGQQASFALQILMGGASGRPLTWAERNAIEAMVQAAMLVYFDYQYARLAQMLRDGLTPDWNAEALAGQQYLLPSMTSAYQIGVTAAGLEIGGIGVDWALFNDKAVDWAKEHTAETLRTISKTTADRYGAIADEIGDDIAQWIEEGNALPKLVRTLAEKMPQRRAEMVASTEVTRAFAEANARVWQESGEVEGTEWRTAMDEIVCEICGSDVGLEGQRAKLGQPFVNRAGQQTGITGPPGHVRCRCWTVPVLFTPEGESVFAEETEQVVVTPVQQAIVRHLPADNIAALDPGWEAGLQNATIDGLPIGPIAFHPESGTVIVGQDGTIHGIMLREAGLTERADSRYVADYDEWVKPRHIPGKRPPVIEIDFRRFLSQQSDTAAWEDVFKTAKVLSDLGWSEDTRLQLDLRRRMGDVFKSTTLVLKDL